MIRFKSISRFVAGTAASRAGRITKSSLTPSVLLLVLSSNALQAAPIDAVQNTSWGQKTAGSFAVTGRRTATDPTGGVGNRITATYTVGGTTTTKEVGDLASQGVGLSGLQVTLGGLPSGTIITFRNELEDGNPTSAVTAVGNFNPPGVGVTTPLAVAFGSTATLGASTFNLSGSFATIATGVDYDPASANYGILSGIIPASVFRIQGTGLAGNIALSLSGDLPWMVNMASVWEPHSLDQLISGLSVPFSTPLSGTLLFGVDSTPFSGAAVGNVVFFDNDIEEINATFNFTSDFGPVSGTLEASGASFLTAVPEPETYILMIVGFGMLGLVATCRKQQQAAYSHSAALTRAPAGLSFVGTELIKLRRAA